MEATTFASHSVDSNAVLVRLEAAILAATLVVIGIKPVATLRPRLAHRAVRALAVAVDAVVGSEF